MMPALSCPRTGVPSMQRSVFAACFARSLPIRFQCKIKALFAVRPDNLAGIHTGLAEKFPRRGTCERKRSTTGIRIAKSFGMIRVLLVEDSEDILYLLQLQLEWMGYAI